MRSRSPLSLRECLHLRHALCRATHVFSRHLQGRRSFSDGGKAGHDELCLRPAVRRCRLRRAAARSYCSASRRCRSSETRTPSRSGSGDTESCHGCRRRRTGLAGLEVPASAGATRCDRAAGRKRRQHDHLDVGRHQRALVGHLAVGSNTRLTRRKSPQAFARESARRRGRPRRHSAAARGGAVRTRASDRLWRQSSRPSSRCSKFARQSSDDARARRAAHFPCRRDCICGRDPWSISQIQRRRPAPRPRSACRSARAPARSARPRELAASARCRSARLRRCRRPGNRNSGRAG